MKSILIYTCCTLSLITFGQNASSVKPTVTGTSTARRFSLGVANNNEHRTIVNGGNIGTTSPDQKFTVNGKNHSKEIMVDLSVLTPDYVFERDYKLSSIDEIKTYIYQNKPFLKCLPQKRWKQTECSLGEMNMLLLKKMKSWPFT